MTLSPLRIGLTGGIGSGKSTVSQFMRNGGVAVIDADAISRSMTAANGPAMPTIEKTFGREFIALDGSLNRERMRTHVFANTKAKQSLEAIIHPLVVAQTNQQAQAALAAGHRTLVFDVPLLVESGRWRAQVDRVLVIDCRHETQIQRVSARNQLSPQTITAILSTQASRVQRLHAADWVIYNDAISFDTLRKLVLTLPIYEHPRE